MDIKVIEFSGCTPPPKNILDMLKFQQEARDNIAKALALPAHLLRAPEVLQHLTERTPSGVQTFTVRGDRYGTIITTHTDRLCEVPGGFIFI